jgi:tripartite-type tricarboxylate transporter receptor subunit TctC
MTMSQFKYFTLLAATLSIFAAGAPTAASADTFPSKAVTIIVPWGPGGGTDLTSRVTADYLQKKWGVPVNVVNKPGGNTVPGSLEVLNAAPDGYTLLGESGGSSSVLAVTAKSLPYEVLDRTFIAMTSVSPNVLAVNAKAPYATLADLVADIQKDPSSLIWSSTGGSSTPDIAARQFLSAIGVDISVTKPLTASSSSDAVVLVAGGHSKMSTGSVPTSLPLINSGDVKPLAVTESERHPDLPDVETFAEAGYPTVNVVNWSGLSAPAGVPAEIVTIWEDALAEMLQDAEVIEQLGKVGLVPFYKNSADARARVEADIAAFAELK